MAYQVLARKWRPGTFADLVGQQHVVRALSNALTRGQLHHAYLFTGTRGVGKTTLARILSKALNCEQGVSASPCGVCTACREVDEGRFVDLLEVDAASRTKVDQTRELLENVPFAPVKGRFKVYLIDEVHMFSAHSFNALLKTLEEPPPHVKFLLATTDPQKVPVTVLSRCLQFNLKRLLPDEIKGQMAHILEQEGIDAEPKALALLAKVADGSMRDGLSLLDQAIAYGGGRVGTDEVTAMLGAVSSDAVFRLIQALAENDGVMVLDEVERAAELTPDFSSILREALALLHRIALTQQVPGYLPADDPDHERIAEIAARIPVETVQLFYQILLVGQQDLALAPDPRTGLEMVLLRALAFLPEPIRTAGRSPAPEQVPLQARGAADATPRVATPVDTARRGADLTAAPSPVQAPVPVNSEARDAPAEVSVPSASLSSPEDWHNLLPRLRLGGIASQLAQHCELVAHQDGQVVLNMDPGFQQLRVGSAEQRLEAALADALGGPIRLEIRVERPTQETPALRLARNELERQAAAEKLIQSDPVAGRLEERLDAQVVPGSIRPSD